MKKTEEQFIKDSKEKFGDRFDYSKCKYTGSKEKITLIASLLLSKDNDEKKEIIESLFSGKIKDIFSHYFL